MGIRENIADHLMDYKTTHGLSDRKMAEALNVSLATIQNCLKKKGNFRLDTLLHLADQMDLMPEELFLPRGYHQNQKERTKDYLLDLKRMLEDVT